MDCPVVMNAVLLFRKQILGCPHPLTYLNWTGAGKLARASDKE
jgi:hypothetical protein